LTPLEAGMIFIETLVNKKSLLKTGSLL